MTSRCGWFFAWMLAGCQGDIGDRAAQPIPEGGCEGEECASLEEMPAPSHRFTRLSHPQWENTVRELFRLDEPTGLSSDFIADPPGVAIFDTNERRLGMTEELWSQYQRAAEALAESMTADDSTLARFVPSLPARDPERTETFVREFGLRAYRRPLESGEVARYVALAGSAPALYPEMESFAATVRVLLEAFLQAPSFVYRAERSETPSGDVIALDSYEIATRLSYFMWDSMPDDALFEAARAGELESSEEIAIHAERMLGDPRARTKLARFHDQLYDIDEWALRTHELPDWRPELEPMMQEEARRFIEGIVSGGGSLRDLLTSRTTHVNEDLAAFYGLEGVTGPEFREVELDERERAGLLTRLGFLAKNLDEPDILCRPLGDPPVFEQMTQVGETNRERLESVTGPDSCAGPCHTYVINPLGFAFEGYDALGRFRADDDGHAIDDAALYRTQRGEDVRFDGAIELSSKIAELEDPHRCYATRLLEYQYGRPVSAGDTPWLYRAAQSSLAGAPMRDLVTELVSSRTFRTRALEELAIAGEESEEEVSP
jgi:hypothetical protein